MAWVSVHQQIRDHRKTRDLYRMLKISRQEAIGILVLIWTWALDNCSKEGELLSTTIDDIADAAYWNKKPEILYEALKKSGWIDEQNDKIYLHDWYDFNKPFYQYIERKNKDRTRKKTTKEDETTEEFHGNSTEIPQEFHDSPAPAPAPAPNNKDILPNGSTSVQRTAPPYQEIINFYNQHKSNMPAAKTLSEKRKGYINARVGKYGIDVVKEVIIMAEQSDFLNGGGKKGWIAPGFDWIMSPENFPKVYEGKFDNKNVEATEDKYERAKRLAMEQLKEEGIIDDE